MNPLLLSAAIQRAKIPAFALLGRPLLVGNPDHGYFGEFSSTDVIRGDTLATQVGVRLGTAIHVTDGWLGFALNGKRLLVAKKPIRHSISWDALSTAGVVFGKEIPIQNTRMLVRLPKGVFYSPAADSTTFAFDDDSILTHGSEWNRLLYHVSATVDPGRPSPWVSSEGIQIGTFAQFTHDELGISGSAAWRANWCQEPLKSSTGNKIIRGNGKVAEISYTTSWNTGGVGWRPVLELIE